MALEASYGRSCLIFLREGLKPCINKPEVVVGGGSWYRWALERLGLDYEHQRFGSRNRVERLFRYLREKTSIFHHKISARDYGQGIGNLKLFLNLFTPYYQTMREVG